MASQQRTENVSQEPQHPIQVAARRTGLTADAIRAWEKRYGAVEPFRTPGGRRLYSDEDIERLLLLRRVTAAGRRIGEVAGHDLEQLRAIVSADEEAMARVSDMPLSSRGPIARGRGTAASHLTACIEAAKQLDASRLERELASAQVQLTTPVLLEQVLSPLLEEIGDRWRRGFLKIAHEHLLSALVRSMLTPDPLTGTASPDAPGIVITTPAGQVHELGALMVAVAASADGWRVIYLGPNMPADEIAHSVRESGARAIGLSLIYPSDDPRLPEELRRIRRHLPEDVAMLVGGRASHAYNSVLDEIRAYRLDSLQELRDSLSRLRD
ncbi:MAG: cobalamin-dependent protein [Acidobacteriota bacterium]|nr:MAG: cobalamin-dependent protein [Acidobacteriota bacterium]